jgi:hypothetical protein
LNAKISLTPAVLLIPSQLAFRITEKRKTPDRLKGNLTRPGFLPPLVLSESAREDRSSFWPLKVAQGFGEKHRRKI